MRCILCSDNFDLGICYSNNIIVIMKMRRTSKYSGVGVQEKRDIYFKSICCNFELRDSTKV